ncbi:transposable element Tcb1 transposase [Trichonephila clavipes]|nr:transposable element Tcb1 transposase [Trichonephila clavipes]
MLEEFDYEVCHRPSRQMKHVDALSRSLIMRISPHDITQKMKDAQNTDEFISQLKSTIKFTPSVEYFLKNEILYKFHKNTDLLVVPEMIQREIVLHAHAQGHFASKNTESIVSKEFYIPRLTKIVQDLITNCVPCILSSRKAGIQIHWCAKIKDEVEKLAYQLNEEAERTERPIRRLSRIIGKLEEGRSVTSVAAEFGIAHSIVSRLWRQFQTTGTAIRRLSSGRPRGTTPADDRYIVLQARRNRRQTAGEIARHTTQATGRPISRFTVVRRLHGGGLFARRPVRCVPLTPAHRRRRSLWCREHRNWRDNEWGRVFFTDESRFSLSSDSHSILIWRELGSRNHPSNIIERDKGAMGLQFLFMDDNAPCHRTVAAEQLLESEDIKRMDWPVRSPDLTPIEHPDGHGYELVSSVRALEPQKFSVEEELMHVKHVEIKSPHVGVMWKFRREVISSATRGLLATNHVILNHGQVTWTTPELAPPLLTTTPHQREDVSALDRFNVHRCPTLRVFSGTGLEPVTKQATVRYLYHSATAAT